MLLEIGYVCVCGDVVSFFLWFVFFIFWFMIYKLMLFYILIGVKRDLKYLS